MGGKTRRLVCNTGGDIILFSKYEFYVKKDFIKDIDPLGIINVELWEYKKCVWLPRQDQLQDMVWDSLGTYCSNKMNSLTWGVWDFYNTIDDVDSMEQLWLAFVMRELYNKQWNGNEWAGGN